MIDFNKFVKDDSLVIKNSQVNVRELVDFLQIGELESFLKGNTFIKKLSLIDLNIGDSGVEVLANSNLENLTSLVLESNGIGDEGARALANLTNLTSLTLKNNKIGTQGAIALARGKLTNLTSLVLESNGIGAIGAKALANGRLTNLTSLVLSWNKIGDEGVVGLTNGNLKNLTSFCLKFDIIHAKGLKALANFENLTSLSLEWDVVSPAGAEVLAKLTNLTSLYLTGNGIKYQGIKALAKGNFTNLTSLVFESNEIGDVGAEALSEALKKDRLTNLTSLSLASNKIGNAGAEALSEALKKDRLTNLTPLNLTGNRIGNKGAKALREARKNLTILGLRSDAKAVTVRTNSVSEPEIFRASSSKSAAHPFVKRSKSDAVASHHKAEQQPTQFDQQQKPNAQLGLRSRSGKGLTSVVAKCGKKFLSLVRKGALKRKYPSELEVSTMPSDTSIMPSPSKRFKSGEEADNHNNYEVEQQRTQFDRQQELDVINQQQESSAQTAGDQSSPNRELSETQSMPHNQPHQRV